MSDPIYLDPKAIYADELQHWREFWDNSLSLYENVYNLCLRSVCLPSQKVQLPIAATYILIPSKWSKILPILFSWGDKGSGKTTFATLAARLHGQEHLFSSADTFASIRNSLDSMRWIDGEKQFEADGVILCWDNLSKETLLRDEKIYQLLLFGYNRSSERIQIAQPDGTNRTFFCFCPKVISSVQPLHNYWEFDELHRRLLVIHHKQLEKLNNDDLSQIKSEIDFEEERIDLDSINWNGIDEKFFDFWNDEGNCRLYARYRSSLTRKGKKTWVLPESMDSHKWVISIDLITAGLVLGSWQTIQEGIDKVDTYWQYITNVSSAYKSNTFYLIQEWLEEQFSSVKTQRELIAKFTTVEPLRLTAKQLKDFLANKQNEGSLDINPHNKDLIKEIMRELGWKLSGNYWIEIL